MTVEFEVRHVIAASPAVVHRLLDDSASWPSWTPIDRHEPVRPPGPDGLGEVRRFHNGRYVVTEEIVAREPGRRLSYTLLSGLPLHGYRADIDLTALGGPSGREHTALRWHTRFTPNVPATGWLYRWALVRATRGFVDGLAAFAPTAGR